MARKPAKSSKKAGSALDALLKDAQQSPASISSLTTQFSSVMSLAQADIPRLMKQNPGMHITEARDIDARAKAMSVVIARRFREQRLSAAMREANRPPSGIKGLVEGPTYTEMFNPDWANHCPPDAIEATHSPVAYLTDLYRFAKELEATGDPAKVITLDVRRPDLKDMMLDHTALNRVEPTIVLVNEILEKSIRTHLDGIGLEEKTVDDALLETRYPNALPFERYTSQINYALGRKDRMLGDAVRAADPDYPYFKAPGVHSRLSDMALIQDTGFGPVQQGLLLDAPYFTDPAQDTETRGWRIEPRTRRLILEDADEQAPSTFFQDNFGVGGLIDLLDTQTFCLRTGLKTEELEALLSVGAFAPVRSPNIKAGAGDEVDGSFSGSVYINAGQFPAMAIETDPGDEAHGQGTSHRIVHATPDRFDRMNRMIRLARWLDLPFDEVDKLLVASMQAERHALSVVLRVDDERANRWHITQDTLRSLGLFQIVRKRFKVAAEDFAALLYGLNVYGRGKAVSQFDRVFNSQALFSLPLILDDELFSAIPRTEAERQKIDHLCAALGMTFEVYRYVVKVVEQSLAGAPLRWSREVVSAFYRLVRLPRSLGLSTVEAMALLELLNNGGSQFVSKLAGVARIASYNESANTDTLSVIHALVDCSLWLKEHGWDVVQLCRLVLPPITQPVATDAEYSLLQQMHTRLLSALITDNSFAQEGAPDVSITLTDAEDGGQLYVAEPIDWFAELSDFIDAGAAQASARGLVKYLNGEAEESFENALSQRIRSILESKGLPVEELHPKLTNMVMRARGAQEALLMEGLAGYLGTSADLARTLLFWTEGNRHQLLREVLRVYGASVAGQLSIGDEILLVLDALGKRAALANHLGLSPALIGMLIENPSWFGLADAGLSMQLVYIVSQYAAIVRLSEQKEDALLDYFQLINTLWEDATEGDRRLIRDSAASKVATFLRWGVRDVLEVAFHLNADGVIFTLKDLGTVAAVRLIARHTRLDARALLALHGLTPTSATEIYRQAAERALSCLTEALPGDSDDEVGQSLTPVITVTPDYLIANLASQKATYTITLSDFMGEPLEGVTIRWSADLGELDQSQTTTDENGISSTLLHSGKVMGVVNLVARFGLGEELKAPIVTIDCDEATIKVLDGAYAPSKALSNKLEPIDYSVRLMDAYGNIAIDRMVEWTATLGEFQRHQTYTDQSGWTHAELRSRSAGVSTALAQYRNGDDWRFQEVEFISIPYFEYVRFASTVIVDLEVAVECRLVELDGTPRVGASVSWSASEGLMLETSSQTDAQGIATARYKASATGQVVVTVSAGAPVVDKRSASTVIHPLAVIVRQEASSEEFLVGSPDPIVFRVWLEMDGSIASRTLVEWETSEGVRSTSYSDKDGMAVFNSRFTTGVHTVTAKVSGTQTPVTFSVTALPPVKFEVSIEGSVIDPDTPDLISRIATYYLVVKTVDEAETPIAGLRFTLDFVGSDPSLLGLQIDGLGEEKVSSIEGVRFRIKAGQGDRGDFTLKLSGSVLDEWRHTYKLGWIYAYRTAVLRSSGSVLDLKWVCVTSDLDPYNGPVIEHLADVVFSVPDHSLEFSVPVRLAGRPAYLGTPQEDVSQLQHGTTTRVSRQVAFEGYLVMLAGAVALNRQ